MCFVLFERNKMYFLFSDVETELVW